MFALTYAQAREDFLEAARRAEARVQTYPHPLKGRQREDLALDIAVLGDTKAQKRLLVSSGCHGVEGYCGSGIQVAALRTEALLALAKANDVTLIFAHALNPYGFSHLRRATEDNVDLNRNFQNFDQALPVNTGYAEFHEALLPEHWPPDAENQASVQRLLEKHGMPHAQAAITGGQYSHADGLHFGGTRATWSHERVRQLLREYGRDAASLAWIDLHTGLGPSGHGERIFSPSVLPKTPAALNTLYERANRWWGGNGATRLTRHDDGTSVGLALNGTLSDVGCEECPGTEITKVTLELGTKPPLEVLQAMRGEQWLQLHPEASPELAGSIKQNMLDAFFVNTDTWKRQVSTQGMEMIEQAITGLTA
jgi:Protein of unknown function (DUF2817)